MTANELLKHLADCGVELEPAGIGLRIRAAIPPDSELRELIRQHKPDLLAVLRPPEMTDANAELLLRYELGEFEPDVRRRLAEIFEDSPPDALARLARACDHLGIDGSQADRYGELAVARDREVN